MRILSLIFSICLHALVLIVVLTVGASVRSRVDLNAPVYKVRLVSVAPGPAKPAQVKAAPEPKKTAKEEKATKPEAEPVKKVEQPKPASPEKVQAKPEPAKAKKPQAKPEPKKTKDISPDKKQTKAPKPKKREPEKKAPPQPSPEEILAQALSAAKTKAAKEQETEQQQVDRALQQLRQQVDEQARESGGGESSGASGAMEVYASIVEALVKKNWRYPAIGQSEELTATVEIDIDPSGAITGQRLTWGSGRPEFDASVLKAVSQTKSLPPPPTKDISRITINFNLQELNP